MKQTSISVQKAIALFVKDSQTGRRLKAGNRPISAPVIRQYLQFETNFHHFETHCAKQFIIQFLYSRSAQRWNREKKYWKSFLSTWIGYARQHKGWSDAYMDGQLRTLKAVFNYLANEFGYPVGNFHKGFKIQTWQAPPLVIMPEKLHRLIHDESFYKGLKPCLQKVTDIMIVGCTIGLRYKDLMGLRSRQIEKGNGHDYLLVNTSKTGARVRIPLPAYVSDIFRKYRRANHGRLLPSLSNNECNRQMKQIGRLAGWCEELPRYRSVKGRPAEVKNAAGKTMRFYEHLSAHTMRRTAITTLLLMGVEEAVVRTISGHAPGSREFYRYVAFVQGYLDKQVVNAYRLLTEKPDCYRC